MNWWIVRVRDGRQATCAVLASILARNQFCIRIHNLLVKITRSNLHMD